MHRMSCIARTRRVESQVNLCRRCLQKVWKDTVDWFFYLHLYKKAGGRYFRFSTNSNMFPRNTAFHHSKDQTTTHAAVHGNTHVTETVRKTLNCY